MNNTSEFQKRQFENYAVKAREERSDKIVTNIIRKYYPSTEKTFRILDIGCGGGRLLKEFANTQNLEIYGVDISTKALRIAKKNGYKTSQCDIEKESISYRSNFFDIVVINDLIEHIVDPDHLLKEVRRILKIDGILVINVPNISHPASWFVQIFLDLPPIQSARYKSIHIRDYTLRMTKLILKLNGFEILKIRGTFIYPFNNILSRVIANLFPRFSERIILTSKKGDDKKLEIADVYFDIRRLLSFGE